MSTIVVSDRLVSLSDFDKLPPAVRARLRSELSYVYRRRLVGKEAYAITGERQAWVTEPRKFYWYNGDDFVFPVGLLSRVLNILSESGVRVDVQTRMTPSPRPGCYTPDWEVISRGEMFQLRAGQLECLQAVANNPGGVIHATMGFGKTFLFSAICALFPRARIAVVCPGIPICRTAHRRLLTYFPNVGLYGGGKKIAGERITVFSADSVHYSDEDYDIVLCDEAHALVSDKRSSALLQAFPRAWFYGFTGTPTGRGDGADARLEAMFGPIIFRLTYPEAVAAGLVVPLRVRWVPVRTDPVEYGSTDTSRFRWCIWRNQQRNQVIADDIRSHVRPDTQVLVSVATFEHAVHLWQLLPDFQLCYSSADEDQIRRLTRLGVLPPDFTPMNAAQRNQLAEGFERGEIKRVIATDVWSTGVDFSSLQVLYRCDARSSEILDNQWPGRVARLDDGKEFGEIVDFVDYFDETFYRKSVARRRHYKKNGWEQLWPT